MHSRPDPDTSTAPILVTGATGFIGRRVTALLLQKGQRVRAVVRPQREHDERVPSGCDQYPAALTDAEGLARAAAGCRAVVYCAGSVRGGVAQDFADANIGGVRAMAQALGHANATAPLLLLSSLAAGRPALSHYAYSKSQGEQVLEERPALRWTIIRPPAVYGPGDREMLPLLRLIRRGLVLRTGPEDQRLSLLHVDDLAAAVAAWLAAPEPCRHRVFEIDDGTPGGYGWLDIGRAVGPGSPRVIGVPRTLLNLAAGANLLFSRLFAYRPMLSPGKALELVQPEWLCDNRAFTSATGWRPRLDLEHGARQLFSSRGGGAGA